MSVSPLSYVVPRTPRSPDPGTMRLGTSSILLRHAPIRIARLILNLHAPLEDNSLIAITIPIYSTHIRSHVAISLVYVVVKQRERD
jgi:hypothetical protein